MVELVDTLVLGTSGVTHPGSSPGASTISREIALNTSSASFAKRSAVLFAQLTSSLLASSSQGDLTRNGLPIESEQCLSKPFERCGYAKLLDMSRPHSETRTLIMLALPIVLAQIAHVLLGIIDTVMVGPLGPAAIGGIGVGNSILFVMLVVGLGVLLSMDTFVSAAFGAHDPKMAHTYLVQGLWLALLLSVPLTLAFWIVAELFPYFGSTPEIMAVTQPFLKISSACIPFFLISVAFQRYWQARQQANIVMITGLLACLLNIVANYAFIYGHWGMPELGTQGVAYATLICRIFIAVALWIYTEIHEGLCIRRPKYDSHLQWKHLKELLTLGLPSGGQCLLEVSIFSIAGIYCSRFGAESAAAHQIILSIAGFTFMLPLGIGSATAVRVGFHRGAGHLTAAKQSGWLGITLAAAVMLICAIVILVIPEPILHLFTQDSLIIETALQVTVLVGAFQVFDGVQVAAIGALRGMENTSASLWMNLIGHYGVGLGIGLWMSHVLHPEIRGVWLGLACGLMVVATGLVFIWHRLWKKVAPTF